MVVNPIPLCFRMMLLLLLAPIAFAVELPTAAEPSGQVQAGPLAHEFSLTLEPGTRGEYFGPFFSWQETEYTKTWTMAPLFSRWRDEGTDSTELDVLYPIFSIDRFGGESRWHFFQLLSLSKAGVIDGADVSRFTVFPLYFQQRSEDPEKNYTAVAPFYGTIRNRIFRDEYYFVMTPAFLRTRKRDVVTDNYLFPFFHIRYGDGLSGWQLWPFYGEEHRAVGVRTNIIEEPQVVGGHDKQFVLWPFYMKQFTGIGTDNPDRQVLVFPLYHTQRSTHRDTTAIIPPLFSWLDDREDSYREYRFPYPLIVWSVGEGETGWRVWPLYGDFYKRGAHVTYALWPVYRSFHLYDTDFERDRTRVMFFLYNNVRERNRKTGDTRQATYLWPLFAAERELDGRERFQMLAFLEPVIPVSESIRRNWSPLWSLWRTERNPKAQRSSESFLWNLYRGETVGESRKCSLLFGLIQYQSTPEGSRWRWFFLPSGKARSAAPPAQQS